MSRHSPVDAPGWRAALAQLLRRHIPRSAERRRVDRRLAEIAAMPHDTMTP